MLQSSHFRNINGTWAIEFTTIRLPMINHRNLFAILGVHLVNRTD